MRPIAGAINVSRIDQLQPAPHAIGLALAGRQLRLDVAPQIGP